MQLLRAQAIVGISIDVPMLGTKRPDDSAFDFSGRATRGTRKPEHREPAPKFTGGVIPQDVLQRPDVLAVDPSLITVVAVPGAGPGEPIALSVAVTSVRSWSLSVGLTSDFDPMVFPGQALAYRFERAGAMLPFRSFATIPRNNHVAELATVGEGSTLVRGDVRLSVPKGVAPGTYRVVMLLALHE